MLKTWVDDGKDGESYAHFYKIFHELGINDLFEWFYDHNTARNNPYHNNVHTYIVVDLIHQYCEYKGLQGQFARTLHIAALFHDFCHSSGKLTDEENIKIACDGLIKAKNKCGYADLFKSQSKRLLSLHWLLILYMIRLTQYPYKSFNAQFLNRETVLLIRQADILSYEHEQWEKYVFEGLCGELKKEKSVESLKNLIDFHEKLANEQINNEFFIKVKETHFEEFKKAVEKTKVKLLC